MMRVKMERRNDVEKGNKALTFEKREKEGPGQPR